MRLTLRYMLAYMEGILDAETTQQIRKRIEESEVATGLFHRIKDVMRRPKLGAPSATDGGGGLDPNTVAEYLDNSLPHERVPDFEKVCLESDAHLAEVAACHQILALVLGEPAEVDPDSRRRMYQLAQRLNAKPKADGGQSSVHAPSPGGTSQASGAFPIPKVRPSVPDYLREPRSRRAWPVVVFLAAVILMAVTAALLIARFRPDLLGPIARYSPFDRPTASAPPIRPAAPSMPQAVVTPPGVAQRLSGDSTPPQGAKPLAEQATQNVVAATSRTAPQTTPGPQIGSTVGIPQTPSLSLPEAIPPDAGPRAAPPAATPFAAPPVTSTEANPPVASAGGLAPSVSSGQPASTGSALPSPAAPPNVVPPTESATADTTSKSGADSTLMDHPIALPADGTPELEPGATISSALPEPVGQLTSLGEILLKRDPGSGNWDRLGDRATLMSRDVLLALPTFRPVVTLISGPQIELIDDTHIQILSSNAEEIPNVSVFCGRLLMRTTGLEAVRLGLQSEGLAGVISFADPDSILAVEVGRTVGSASDPETQPSPLKVDLMAVTGRVTWQNADGGEPMVINPPVRLTLTDQVREAVPMQQSPEWITSDSSDVLERLASQVLREEVAVGRSPLLSLRELADHRREEVQNLSLRCLSAMGDFELLVKSLNDREQVRDWQQRVEQLRAAIARNPQAAAQVRSSMENVFGSEGTALYEMLWKYNGATTLSAEDAGRLVEYLDNDDLAFRIVSFWNVSRITGLGLSYRPEELAPKRQQAVQRWKERLKGGFPGQTPGSQPR